MLGGESFFIVGVLADHSGIVGMRLEFIGILKIRVRSLLLGLLGIILLECLGSLGLGKGWLLMRLLV